MTFLQKLTKVPGLGFFLRNKTVASLIGKSLLLLIIPYAYLILCGLVFDMWLKMYDMVVFIFISFVSLYAIAFVIIGFAIACFAKRKAIAKRKAAPQAIVTDEPVETV